MDPASKAKLYEEGGRFLGQVVRLLFYRVPKKKEEPTKAEAETPKVALQQPAPVQPMPAISLPTKAETTAELKRRLGRELYRAELDLAAGLKIAGKPCTCLESKHTLMMEAAAEELIAEDPGNSVYLEIIQWIKENQTKVTVPAIASGQYALEYPRMASEFKDLRKRVMGTVAASDIRKPGQRVELSGAPGEGISLEQAKKIAAAEAAREVERLWKSPETK